ncbi:HepT-like ribonuclease domain-containing protein [Desulfitibacter alkalitolerans]|uniref:HepT-like ribonuclease domain-containing protein n=1 Tax=Desulfitibacter alkalitolerans TaxID=264641 RepID=UPI000481EB41|nr:HepT-like ribonuclease domain-containing protein [Desulfitibacter alkalitolerans]
MNYRDLHIVKKILSEITIVEALIDGFNLERFLKDERTKRAACMTLINIGELVKNLTEEFKSNYNLIPWRAIAGMRDITVHKYQTLKMGDVWVTLENDIPNLKLNLIGILNEQK